MSKSTRVGNHFTEQLPYFPDVLDMAGEGPDVGEPLCDADGILIIVETPHGVCPDCLGALECYEGELYCPECVTFGLTAEPCR